MDYLGERVIYATEGETVDPAYREKRQKGELKILDWNNWNFLKNETKDSLDPLERDRNVNKLVAKETKTDTILNRMLILLMCSVYQ